MHHLRGSIYKLHIFTRPLFDNDKKGKMYSEKGEEDVKKIYKIIDLQLIICGGMVQRKLKGKILFHSGR